MTLLFQLTENCVCCIQVCVSGSRGFGVGVHSLSTVTPHGLLPLLSLYSLLLGDTVLPQYATQAKHLSVPPPEQALRDYCDSSLLFQHTFSDLSPLCSNWLHSVLYMWQHGKYYRSLLVTDEGVHLCKRRTLFLQNIKQLCFHVYACI